MEYSYLKKGSQFYPIIDVKLKNNKSEIILKALVDSGASFSIFRAEVAEYLGVSIENGKKIYLEGIGGRILGYLHSLVLIIEGKRYKSKIIFSRELTVSFNILGRNNFFIPFQIIFREKDKKIIIQKI